ncbi:GSCOCG00006859001-RA-CDS [Cotesia congregata]|nr:GSCOCG00006859001-RA-CDS [Cotesia congregata]
MNKSPFSTPRGRGQNGNQKPYYRKQRGYWDSKNSNQVSPTNNSSQKEKNLNTSGSSDDYIPFNNSLPSPFNKSLPSPSLASPPAVSTSSPFFHVQKQGGQFYGQHQRYSLGNESPSHSPRGRRSFNQSFSPGYNNKPFSPGFNNRAPRGRHTVISRKELLPRKKSIPRKKRD